VYLRIGAGFLNVPGASGVENQNAAHRSIYQKTGITENEVLYG
jgi:hypothetical protein